jgi:hypothetical protein
MLRIAFDLDDTLIPCDFSFPLEPRPWLARLLGSEPLRAGSVDLLRALRTSGAQLWVYTTSLRDPFAVWLQFLLHGIRLGGVVNQDRHLKKMQGWKGQPSARDCSKYPPAFGIDLLIDNSEGVVLEGRRWGFRVLHVRPDDLTWAQSVRAAVGL